MKKFPLTSMILLSMFFLNGCGLTINQKEAVGRFAASSMEVGQFTASEIPRLRGAVVDMNKTSVAIRGSAKPGDLDGPIDLRFIFPRVAAANALASYGKLLLALLEDTQAEELQAASNQFVDSFKNVPGINLSNDQLNSIGTLVQEAGGLFVEHIKAKKLKAIIPKTRSAVATICDLLIRDLDPKEPKLSGAVENTIVGLRADISIALADPKSTVNEREIAINGQKLADGTNSRLEFLGSGTIDSLNKLKVANGSLEQVLSDDKASINDIRAYGKQVRTLADTVKILAGD